MSIPGISTRAYSDADLKRIEENDNRTFEYGDKAYNAYEATQRQRRIETAIRKEKLSLLAFKEANDNEKFTQHSLKLQRLHKEYKQFSKTTGLATQNERHQLLGFDRSIAQQAVQQVKRQLNSELSDDILGMKRADGGIAKYRKSTNDFVVGSKHGNISTLFKPDEGYNYWLDQVEIEKK